LPNSAVFRNKRRRCAAPGLTSAAASGLRRPRPPHAGPSRDATANHDSSFSTKARQGSALTASPGARAHYDRRKDTGDRHAAAQRNLFGRLLGCLWRCLNTGQYYNETIAFPAIATKDRQAA
jgi:hypothetical protein